MQLIPFELTHTFTLIAKSFHSLVIVAPAMALITNTNSNSDLEITHCPPLSWSNPGAQQT